MQRTKANPVSRQHDPQERITNDAPKFLKTFGIGDVSHQGDLMIIGIARLPRSARRRQNRQLADGDTQGSRHVLTRGTPYDADPAEVSKLIHEANGIRVDERYVGPVFVSDPNPTEDDLDHPEHGNQGFPAEMVCATAFQRNQDAEEREVRTRD